MIPCIRMLKISHPLKRRHRQILLAQQQVLLSSPCRTRPQITVVKAKEAAGLPSGSTLLHLRGLPARNYLAEKSLHHLRRMPGNQSHTVQMEQKAPAGRESGWGPDRTLLG